MSMRQPINNEMETRLIHPEEAHYESQATVRPDNRPESQGRSIKSPQFLKQIPYALMKSRSTKAIGR